MVRASAQELVYREELWQPASVYNNSLPTTSGRNLYSDSHGQSRTMPTFELMVPMSSATCEDQVRAALDLEGVVDVQIDSYNYRVVVTGYVDPTQALMQARLVNRDAAMWSVSTNSTGNPFEERTYNRTFTREPSIRGLVTASSGDNLRYFATNCPGYTNPVSNRYAIPNPDNNVEHTEIH